MNFVIEAAEFMVMTVAEFKLRVQDKESLPPEQQRLNFAGKTLQDQQLLVHCGVQNNSTLFLVARLLGGLKAVVVKKLTGAEAIISICHDAFNRLTVEDFKILVEQSTGVPSNQQRLLIGGKELENGRLLVDYNVQHNTKMSLIDRRLLRAHRSRDRCVVTLDDEAYEMPGCKHALSAVGLEQYIRSLIDNGRHRLCCPAIGCDREWSYVDLRRLGIFSDDAMRFFEAKLGELYALHEMGAKACPECMTCCVPMEDGQKRMRCLCNHVFCWLCMHEWQSSGHQECSCGHCPGGCNANRETLKLLRESPILPGPFPHCGVFGVPIRRLCPSCGAKYDYDGQCKHMTCVSCKTTFCHLCLQTQAAHKGDSWSISRPCPVAPVQEVIPGR